MKKYSRKNTKSLKLRNPSTLKVGAVKKSNTNGKYYKVSKAHKWVPATKNQVLCDRYLKRKIKTNIREYKSGLNKKNSRIKTAKQAIAIAYSQTRKAKPRCAFLNKP